GRVVHVSERRILQRPVLVRDGRVRGGRTRAARLVGRARARKLHPRLPMGVGHREPGRRDAARRRGAGPSPLEPAEPRPGPPPRGEWPTAAELDTFLFAAGGKPYRCYPAGTLSPVGIFAGYDPDTLCTHFETSRTLHLQRLDHYRNIVWMVDLNSAFLNTNSP